MSIFTLSTACGAGSRFAPHDADPLTVVPHESDPGKVEVIRNEGRVVHILVALADNENQGIVPVSASLGDGSNPDTNLYWGAAFGVRTYFGKSKSWDLVEKLPGHKPDILERIVFRHHKKDVLIIADAYRGDKIRAAIVDTLASLSGRLRTNTVVEGKTMQIYGGADLVAFVGHNGLMDFDISDEFAAEDRKARDAIILACASRQYFKSKLLSSGANPLLWTTNLMAPEAYILHDAIEGWIADEDDAQVRTRAAKAYSKYQRISVKSAEGLLVTGWE
ncbi:MAG: hypothetical protein DWQ47_14995 [Acidobacteria bacterium]|nr:MAG: hypothetical protein DWQ38_09740 [Acidobacteriota bacterium]REK13568.1 MAG: hypothetical protein DWQ43_08085 [Acidobacteriota bacterium]REK41562.1 MAG: hypothetical protein DWQ47_14995 [Acidobacteriota bacterium]